MPAPRHEQSPSSKDVACKTTGLEFDASERLRLMESGLPLCIFLESSEIVALKPPAPLYIFVPRVSYLPTLIDKCHEHFKPYIQPSFGQPASPFFDFGGIPIDWRLPIGVAFDILSSIKGGHSTKRLGACLREKSGDDIEFSELASCGCDVQLPWCLTIHFHGSASSYLSGGSNKLFALQEFWGWASFESFFINSLKQATYIINGSAIPFQRLAKAAEMQLLTSSRTGSIAQFLEGCNQLLPSISPRYFRRIPVRLYICGPPCIQLSLSFPCFKTNKTWCAAKTLDDSNSCSTGAEHSGRCDGGSEPIGTISASPVNKNSTDRQFLASDVQSLSTLGDLVHHVLPQLFPKLVRLEDLMEATQCENTADALSPDNWGLDAVECGKAQTVEVIQEPGCVIGRRSCCVIVHGIQPLLQTPLFWLAATAPQLDMFLHVVVVVSETLMGNA